MRCGLGNLHAKPRFVWRSVSNGLARPVRHAGRAAHASSRHVVCIAVHNAKERSPAHPVCAAAPENIASMHRS
jgi:hypothetical protein